MRQGSGCNIGDRWQVTARAENREKVRNREKDRNGEIGRNGGQDNIVKIGNGIPEWSGVFRSVRSGLVGSGMQWKGWNAKDRVEWDGRSGRSGKGWMESGMGW